jgi:glycolate dehydrogenase FAD-binding subunit
VSLHIANRRLLERMRDESIDADADFVVSPTSVEEAAEVLAVAAEAGAPVSFYGGGTHRRLGNPVAASVVITSRGMDRIVDYEPDDLTIVVEPGVTLTRLAEVLAGRRLTAVLPETEPDATVGGVVAGGRSGFRRLRYGPTRDRVLQVAVATGYGKVVTGGSPVVKASTGYGMPRLFTGSMGSLGMIGAVRLKLWAEPMESATVVVDDPEAARRSVYRPVAVLGSGGTWYVYLSGTREEVEAQAELLGGSRRDGLEWPVSPDGDIRLSFRVPARHTAEAVDRARNLDAFGWIAQYGVGVVEAGYGMVPVDGFTNARRWAESMGGALVIEAAPEAMRTELGAWGSPPASLRLQREVKQRFDPSGICNPGILPGGL